MKKPPRITARRAAIVDEIDRLHDQMLAAVMTDLLRLRFTPEMKIESVKADLEAILPEAFRTAALHGYCLAILATRMDLGDLKLKPEDDDTVDFAAKPDRETFEGSLAYWTVKLKLTADQIERVTKSVLLFIKKSKLSVFDIIGNTVDALTSAFAEAVTTGLDAVQFARKLSQVFDGITRTQAETLFKTTQATTFGEKRAELIDRNAKKFPFCQFVGNTDDRQTLAICKPMSGYIAATDDPVWKIWRASPFHFSCRSTRSAMGYLECIRRGILVRNADRSFSFPKGKRPFGDPPKYAIDAKGNKVRVEPAPGFGQ